MHLQIFPFVNSYSWGFKSFLLQFELLAEGVLTYSHVWHCYLQLRGWSLVSQK